MDYDIKKKTHLDTSDVLWARMMCWFCGGDGRVEPLRHRHSGFVSSPISTKESLLEKKPMKYI